MLSLPPNGGAGGGTSTVSVAQSDADDPGEKQGNYLSPSFQKELDGVNHGLH